MGRPDSELLGHPGRSGDVWVIEGFLFLIEVQLTHSSAVASCAGCAMQHRHVTVLATRAATVCPRTLFQCADHVPAAVPFPPVPYLFHSCSLCLPPHPAPTLPTSTPCRSSRWLVLCMYRSDSALFVCLFLNCIYWQNHTVFGVCLSLPMCFTKYYTL